MGGSAHRRARLLFACLALPLLACGEPSRQAPDAFPRDLRFNEIVSDNEGVWVDELGETDDYVELYNASDHSLELGDYWISDSSGPHRLPEASLAPGEVQLLWADGSPKQGRLHLPFKVSSSGERLVLHDARGSLVDLVEVPELEAHHAYQRMPDGAGAFVDCGWATPGRLNGSACGPAEPVTQLGDDFEFEAFAWPSPWPEPPSPLVITEAALRPAQFVEVMNDSAKSINLDEYSLRLAAHGPGVPWPAVDAGTLLAWPKHSLGPQEYLSIPVAEADVAHVAQTSGFEGVLTVWRDADGIVVDRVDFNAWPDRAVLAKDSEPEGHYHLCRKATPGAPNSACDELADRPVGDRLRSLLTPGDLHALAAGRTALGFESVEFVVDLSAGDVVSFLNSVDWDLHYTFVREAIQGLPHLDRCIESELREYDAGWYAFSVEEYFKVEGRHYLLGTLVRHAGTDLATLEFAPGDTISADQMKHAFLTVMRRVPEATAWSIRPQTPDQIERIRAIEGQVPIVGPNAPFENISFQALAPGVAYGTLRAVRADEIAELDLGPRDIVIADQVPNDIPLIAGLITEAFQTPLAHVNVLSRGRGTPNMALPGARTDARVEPYLDELVRLEVSGAHFTIAPADPEEALAFWKSRKPSAEARAARVDAMRHNLVPLSEASLADLPIIGAKAAQLAELGRVSFCSDAVGVPSEAFAIPVVHSIEHFEASGARDLLATLRKAPAFLADPQVTAQGLGRVRALVGRHPLSPKLHDELVAAIAARWPGKPLRFRSSSNVEDLSGFNGAGLYTSVGVDARDIPDDIDDAVRAVWASLYNDRAFAERDYYNVDQGSVAMAVLVHEGFHSERANGVAISRDVLDPTRGDRYYYNAQVGEALVTNPAPGILSDEFSYQSNGWQKVVYYEKSTFSPDVPVLAEAEVIELECNLRAVHDHFRPLLDPELKNAWFAMDVEFKFIGDERSLLLKQARPYSFGTGAPTGWCDFQ
ncbi:MAG: lamin tail domain-containing protein [Polyangiaceae bacterium]|nr:lamin tail domain-containing protein [Polyangiaceae bacterium]